MGENLCHKKSLIILNDAEFSIDNYSDLDVYNKYYWHYYWTVHTKITSQNELKSHFDSSFVNCVSCVFAMSEKIFWSMWEVLSVYMYVNLMQKILFTKGVVELLNLLYYNFFMYQSLH